MQRLTRSRWASASQDSLVPPYAQCIAGLCIALAAQTAFASPEVPGLPQDRPIALVGGTVHPVSGPAIEGGVLLFDAGKIVAVGREVVLPGNTEKIDVQGKHVYPGMIDGYTHLGLMEIPMVRATNDHTETGRINPNAKAQVAVNPDSELIPVARTTGVLSVLSVPGGGLISGASALMGLDGWTWEEMTIKPVVGVHVRWPQMAPIHTWWQEMKAQEQLVARDKALEEICRAFDEARSYATACRACADGKGAAPDFNARWEALVPVLEGKVPLIIDADEIQQIQSALAFAERERVKVILLGGYDAPHCADLLKQLDVPVIVAGTHRLPRRHDDAFDAPYTVPARLHELGVKFCIASADRASMVRNLPYHAGTAAAYGLAPDEALKAVTLYPAQIFGVADRLGSLEAGKDATLFVTDGDPLETPSRVSLAFITGRRIDLNNRQQRLWEKYQEKYR
ncbi:MAG TPA: amidohydrolase family protein, partial [Pirellulales bacterium]|nr:amidohydrolase family protein [Pirellulales bacterium]